MMLIILHWLRMLIGWLDLAMFTLFMILIALLPRTLVSRIYPLLFHAWCRTFVRALNVDLRLHQKNIKPLPRQYILIANHPSAFEDVGIPALFPVVSLAKAEVANWWIVGRIAVAAGTLFVQRESAESRQAALQSLIDGLKAGKNICLYPESGCKGRRLFKLFRYGAFEASLRSGVPILPVFIHYEAQEDFEWQEPWTLLDKLRHFMTTQNNRANYYVFDAIHPADFADKQQFSDHVYKQYQTWQQKYLE
ncbi:1-acyl-sn-glycerol-3-phosphate acyltransferase [Chitinivorax tropicus]|uniref:1-acyl-sn-glycerol-3-phosphate acyltransferase n=1 Tax=Chitinivorax tropicus TaxID=714531 RepID=A0A840MT46_9PROT|nr:lysophospholipid acyltransferase family protein [Chitinivorax tropicus]MBB5019443.1 1-acyl-sn-glycerol-3-phosphate acyltransferase [Chitinivorax tropicus]